jgi:hypothetical protein
MELNDAASGQGSDNAGTTDPLQSAIEAAFSAAEGSGDDTVNDKAPVAKEPSVTDKEPKTTEKAGDDTTGEDAAKGKTEAKEPDAEAAKDGNANKAFEAPKHWDGPDKQAFAKLPKDGQEVLLKLSRNLEAGFTRKSQELSDHSRFSTTVRGLFSDTDRQLFREAGNDELGAIQHLMQTHKFAQEKPVEFAKWFIQQTGITADRLGFSPTAKMDRDSDGKSDVSTDLRDLLVDPEVKQLRSEYAQLKGYVEEIRSSSENAEKQRYLQGVQAITSTIAEFRNTLDDTGKLAHPHFDTVSSRVAALLDHDPTLKAMPEGQEKLKTAYDMAVRASPDLYKQMLEDEKAAAIAEARKKDEAERAKRITAVKPSVGAPVGRRKPKGLDDIISETMGGLDI